MLCAGTVAAAVINAAPFVERKKWASPVDFVPDYRPQEKKREAQPQSIEEQIAVLTQVMGCGPGKPN